MQISARAAGATLLLAMLALAACTGSGEDVRSGRDVQIERVPMLGVVEQGYWVNEQSAGRGLAPGPSPRWQEGVARLPEDTFDRLVRDYTWEPMSRSWQPPIRSALEDRLTLGGRWLESEDFNAAATTAEFEASFYLEEETHTVLFLLFQADGG